MSMNSNRRTFTIIILRPVGGHLTGTVEAGSHESAVRDYIESTGIDGLIGRTAFVSDGHLALQYAIERPRTPTYVLRTVA